jgi:hypothetical protein
LIWIFPSLRPAALSPCPSAYSSLSFSPSHPTPFIINTAHNAAELHLLLALRRCLVDRQSLCVRLRLCWLRRRVCRVAVVYHLSHTNVRDAVHCIGLPTNLTSTFFPSLSFSTAPARQPPSSPQSQRPPLSATFAARRTSDRLSSVLSCPPPLITAPRARHHLGTSDLLATSDITSTIRFHRRIAFCLSRYASGIRIAY